MISAYALAFGGFLLLGGRSADLLGRRRILITGAGVFTAASLACGLARSTGMLIAARTVEGLGAAMMAPAALALILAMFPEGAERNKALGAFGAVSGAGGRCCRKAALTSATAASTWQAWSPSPAAFRCWCTRCSRPAATAGRRRPRSAR